jgi:hypothetical protein
MMGRRRTTRRGAAVLVVLAVAVAVLAIGSAGEVTAAPTVPASQSVDLVASGYCDRPAGGGGFPVTARTMGTAPTRATVQSTVSITVDSVVVTPETDLRFTPVSVTYDTMNKDLGYLDTGATSEYRFADPAPQQLTVRASVYGPMTVGEGVSLLASVAAVESATPEEVRCSLRSTTPVTVALDLPADGSQQSFRFSAGCTFGSIGRIQVEVGGIAPTHVAAGEHPTLHADLAVRSVQVPVPSTLTFGVTGSPEASAFAVSVSAFSDQVGAVWRLPAAGTDANLTVSGQQLKGTGWPTGPGGTPIAVPFSCAVQGAPILVAVGDTPPVTTSTSTTTTTTTTLPAHPLCRLVATWPPVIRDLLARLLGIHC